MIWLNPAAWFAAAVVAAPVLIHLFAHRRAERVAFPTLRFIQPTRLASLRRRMLDDIPLLLVRAAILLAAVAALAGPFLVTAARARAWDARVVRETVTGGDLHDGIRRAAAALANAPPSRREILVVSPLPLGSVTQADVAAIPASIGIQFERRGVLPATATAAGGSVLVDGGVRLTREIDLNGPATRVRETRVADTASWPVDVDAPASARPVVDAAIAAVLSQRVWAPPPDRRARLLIDGDARSRQDGARQISLPWMAEAVGRMTRDEELQTTVSRSDGALDARYSSAPWHVIALSADGRPLIAAAAEVLQPPATRLRSLISDSSFGEARQSAVGATAASHQLLVVSAAAASDLITPLLLRAIVNGLAAVPDLQATEVVAIPDAQLRAWSRPAAAPLAPSPDHVDRIDRDDRRWLWVGTLLLLALETWMRRRRDMAVGQSIEPRRETLEKGAGRVA